MKTVIVLLCAVLIAVSGCKKQEEPNPIEGVWNLIYVRTIGNDTTVSEFPLTYQGSDIKIWTKEHWMFVSRYRQDTVFTDNYGGGTYTLSGNIYVENIEYHKTRDLVGKKLRMLMTVKNDTLIQIWPVDEKGIVNKSYCTVERYTRLE